jgi:hypothetical protein
VRFSAWRVWRVPLPSGARSPLENISRHLCAEKQNLC